MLVGAVIVVGAYEWYQAWRFLSIGF